MATPLFPLRAMQLDLARQVETPDFIRRFVDFIAANGYNALVLYLEGRIKTPSFSFLPDGESYRPEQMTEIVEVAGRAGLEVIPTVSALGHANLFFRDPAMMPLCETRDGATKRFGSGEPDAFCPSQPGTLAFFERYLAEVAALFPSAWFFAGCDEVWDIGRCPLCRARLAAGETQADLFAKHIAGVQTILKKLGKRMIVWDDMYDYYPAALEALDRDAVLACWQYQHEADPAQGHISPKPVHDTLARYDRMGFDYFVCSADHSLRNIQTLTAYASRHKPLGAIFATWEKFESTLCQVMPRIAHAGRRWAGADDDGASLIDEVHRAIFGIDDDLFLRAARGLAREQPYLERMVTADAYFAWTTADYNYDSDSLADAREAIFTRFRDQVNPDAAAIIDEMIITARSRRIAGDLYGLVPAIVRARASRQADVAKLLKLADEIDANGAARLAHWAEVRPGIDDSRLRRLYADYAASLRALPARAAAAGVLAAHFFLPDMYGVPQTRLSIRYADGKDFEPVAAGVYKDMGSRSGFYARVFFIDKARAPAALKVEVSGYGGQGFTYFEAENDAGRFTPASLANVHGDVILPESVLTRDRLWCYAGDRDGTAAIARPERAEAIHGFEMALARGE